MNYNQWVAFSFALDPGSPSLFNMDYPGDSLEALNHCLAFFHAPLDVLRHMPREIAVASLRRIPSIDGYGGLLSYPDLPFDSRMQLARSHVVLFDKAFVLDDYDGACFMWWECLVGAEWRDGPNVSADRRICDELIQVLKVILSLDSDVCRKSALHGLNEVGPFATPESAQRVIKDWMAKSRDCESPLLEYARRILRGDAP